MKSKIPSMGEIYFIFFKGEKAYAINVKEVEGVDRLKEILEVEWGPTWLVGLVFFRGKPVPLIDLDLYLGIPPSSGSYLIVSRTSEGWLGFRATLLGRNRKSEVPPEALSEVPPGIKGRLRLEGREVWVVEPTLILTQGEKHAMGI